MHAKLISKQIGFEPVSIKIELTINSAEELKSLWHRMNFREFIDIDDAVERCRCIVPTPNPGEANTYVFWDLLDELTVDMGMQKIIEENNNG